MSTASLVLTIVAAGVITFSSRATFLLRSAPVIEGWFGRFLDSFPPALFASLAVVQAVAPNGSFEFGPSLVGLVAGTATAILTRRLVVIMLAGWLAALLTRLVA